MIKYGRWHNIGPQRSLLSPEFHIEENVADRQNFVRHTSFDHAEGAWTRGTEVSLNSAERLYGAHCGGRSFKISGASVSP